MAYRQGDKRNPRLAFIAIHRKFQTRLAAVAAKSSPLTRRVRRGAYVQTVQVGLGAAVTQQREMSGIRFVGSLAARAILVAVRAVPVARTLLTQPTRKIIVL